MSRIHSTTLSSPSQPFGNYLKALHSHPLELGLLVIWASFITYFFGFHSAFGPNASQSAISYLTSAWNSETEYEHAYFIPFLIVALIWMSRKKLIEAPISTQLSVVGITLMVLGILFYFASIRGLQWRLAVGSLPLIIMGSCLYLWGWKVSRFLLIPLCLVYFAIPMPGLLQATNSLQLIATKSAYHLSTLFGLDLTIVGNEINSADPDKWGFNVAEGCSGLRSLMALTLVGTLYAYTTQKRLWKGVVLFLATFPLAIMANALRITTIVLIAEYISPSFAGGVYHDWSGFFFFLIFGLAGLVLIHYLLDWNTNRATTRRLVRQSQPKDQTGSSSSTPVNLG